MAPPPNTPSDKPLTLHARYQAPPPPPPAPSGQSTDTAATDAAPPQHHLFTHPIASSLSINRGNGTPTNRTAYLSDLRASVSTMQDEINVFLTARMEEDLQRASQTKNGGEQGRDKKEEENYGEEDEDVDDE